MVSYDLEALNRVVPLPGKLEIDWADFTRWTLRRPDPYDIDALPLLREEG